MELRQLEYFVAVAEESSFTRAAARVHISQSGVSAQVRQLEHELGATLLDRSARNVRLTAAGDAALAQARDVLAAVLALRRSVDAVTGLVRGRLVIGMITGCTVAPLFEALTTFHATYPTIELALEEANSDRLIELIRDGTIDLALAGIAETPPEDLQSAVIVSEGLIAAVPPAHPLARRNRTTLAAVVEHPVVCLPPGTGIRTVFDQACAARRVTPAVALQASAPDAVIDLARRGFGVAILSESMSAACTDLKSITITDVRTPALLALIWSTGPNPARQQLIDHALRAFGVPS
jgi:DNA-binding transcriptional LysR family regulator